MRCARFTMFFAALLLTGCETSMPSSIGLMMVDEVEVSINDLSAASLFSERCGVAGFASENTPAQQAVMGLTQSQRHAFERWQSNPRNRRDIENSVNRQACADHAAEFRRLQSKPLVVTDGAGGMKPF